MKIFVAPTNTHCPQDYYWYENMKHLKAFIQHITIEQALNADYNCSITEIKLECQPEEWLVNYCRENNIKLLLEAFNEA